MYKKVLKDIVIRKKYDDVIFMVIAVRFSDFSLCLIYRYCNYKILDDVIIFTF